MNISHKTEVQIVILWCWRGLYLNWFKSCDTNKKASKHAKNTKLTKSITQMRSFLQNCKKTEMKIFAFCVTTFEPIKILTCSAPQNDCLNFSFVKGINVEGKKWQKWWENSHLSVAKFGHQYIFSILIIQGLIQSRPFLRIVLYWHN